MSNEAKLVICEQSIDITYVPTEQEGFLSLAGILDGFSRRVVGWSMPAHRPTELVLAALDLAIGSWRSGSGDPERG